jgi:hypothetical protein
VAGQHQPRGRPARRRRRHPGARCACCAHVEAVGHLRLETAACTPHDEVCGSCVRHPHQRDLQQHAMYSTVPHTWRSFAGYGAAAQHRQPQHRQQYDPGQPHADMPAAAATAAMTACPEQPHRVSADGATSADTREEQCQQLSHPSGAAIDNGVMMDYAYTNGGQYKSDWRPSLLKICVLASQQDGC